VRALTGTDEGRRTRESLYVATFLTRIVGERGSLQRKYAMAAAVFLVLVLGIILAYGHLISQSLSRRYLEDSLISGRGEAEAIADELGVESVEELEVLVKRREQLIRTLQRHDRRQVIESFEVVDADGEVVFESFFRSEERVPKEPATDVALGDSLGDQDVVETENTFKISVPLGDVGEVVVSVSKARIAERLVRLRRELLTQTITTAALTAVTLLLAFVLVWHLIQRTRRLETQAREAEEFAALGTLAANLAHEIRNPLNSINLNLELLEEDLEVHAGDVTGSLATTRQEVGRLARLVSDFLSYARPSDPVLGEVKVRPLLQDVRDFLRAEATSLGVHLRLGTDLPDASVTGDESQLRQVVLNLVLNAIQAVSGLAAERRVVEVTAVEGDGEVSVVVRDRGDGIPDEEMTRVRRAFYTRRRGGTGLGLAIAERFAEAQGGKIELVNLLPVGFEARVVLPTCKSDVKMSGRGPADAGRRRRFE
jgi:signal transduction histidine kinase